MGKYLVFDLEVENYNELKRFASPWAERNYVVARGWKKQGDKQASWKYYKPGSKPDYLRIPNEVTLLVGLNIKFDLLWEMAESNPDLKAFFKRGGAVWCCQYAEYLIEGMHPDSHMASMDGIIEKYGGTKKLDLVKQLWDAGKMTSEIQEDLLIDYLVGTAEEGRNGGDIGNTEKIFLGQIQKASNKKMVRAIQLRMDGLCATTEMEWNGLKIDVEEAKRRALILEAELAQVSAELDSHVPPMPEGLVFNWNSLAHKSCLIFGGTMTYEQQKPYMDPATGQLARYKASEPWPLVDGEPVNPAEMAGKVQDVFLSGKKKGEKKFKLVPVLGEIKVKYQEFYHTLPGVTHPLRDWATKSTDGAGNPIYGTGAEVIEVLEKRNVPFLKALGRRMKLDKELGTYYIKYGGPKKGYVGMLACVSPKDHIIHHSLRHVNTVTSRLSASDPNMQNIPRGDKSEIKKVFRSRWDDGLMMEADYSQLEVVVQGMLSGDINLCADLRAKIDFHCKRVAAKHGCTYEQALQWCKDETYVDYKKWKAERTKVKEFSFQRAYGAGAEAIAEGTGMTVEEVKTLIAAEDKMYPGISIFNSLVEAAVGKSSSPFRELVTENGATFYKTFRRGYWQSPTGCLYTWRSYTAPDFLRSRGVEDSFSPPELKNYPVQGTGGEIVQIILGKLWRHFVANDNYGGMALLVNTVHDCVWFDHRPQVQHQLAADVKRIMESVPEILTQEFNMEVTVPFPVEVEVGPNMYDLKHYTKEHHA